MIAVLTIASPFLISAAQAYPESSAFVWTDKKEYYPWETVCIFGYGFNAYAQVTVTIQRPDLSQNAIATSTDEFGYFACQYVLDGIAGMYTVTATDGTNTATTTFRNCLSLTVALKICTIGTRIEAKASGLDKTKSYYVKYFDPDGVERRTSPTYTCVLSFTDYYVILPTLPKILGTWTVRLYENGVQKKTSTVYVGKIVWTTDSTYNTMVTSFAQGQTVYFKAIGLVATKYYRFMMEKPDGTRFYVSSWTTSVTTLTGSYTLPTTAPLGTWKLHTREADDSKGTNEHHYVDCCFIVTTPPPPQQYYLTVRTYPPGITTIPGQGWYNACVCVNLTAPEFVPGSTGIRYRFNYWDVDGTPNATGVYEITVHMNANHTATAHYVTQYYLNMTSNPPSVTIPSGTGWYDAGTNASIFAPEFVGITPGASRYRFDGWTTADMTEIADSSATNTTVLMDKAKTVTANYVTQYKVTFNQSGVGTDFTGTVVTIDGTGYGVSSLPVSFWWDKNSNHNFSFASPLVVNSGKKYVWTSTTGLSTLQSDTLTITSSGNVTGNYKTQYQITFNQTGVNLDFTGTVVVIDGTNYSRTALPVSFWWDLNSNHSFAFQSPLVVTSNGKRYVWISTSGLSSSQSGSITVSTSGNIIGNYKTQYKLTVRTNGLGTKITNVYNGTTILGTATDATPYTGWFDQNALIKLDIDSPIYGSPVSYVFTQWTGDASGSDRPVSVTMNSPKDITANYKTQYQVTFSQSGVGTDFTGTVVTIDGTGYNVTNLPKSFWWDKNSNHSFSFASPLNANGKRYVWTSTSGLSALQSGTLNVTSSGSVTGNYKTQYQITVTASPSGALGGTFKVTYTQCGTTYTNVQKTTPWTEWVDASTTVTVSEPQDIINGPPNTRYKFDHYDPSASAAMNQAKTITLVYKTQYKITFSQTGVGADFTGTIVTIDGTNYTTLPQSFWWDKNSTHSFAFRSPLVVTPNAKQYVWANTTGLSTLQSNSIKVSTSGSITGNYKTQYYLAVTSPHDTPTPTSGWFDAGKPITASVTSPWPGPTGTRYVCTGWTGTGSVPTSGTATNVTFTINAPSSITWNWKTQYYLTVRTGPPGIVTIPGEGWYDITTTIPLTAPSVAGYDFLNWDVDGVSQGPGVASITVSMNIPHTATAHYKESAPPPPPPPPVGGYAAPIDIAIGKETSHLPSSQIGLAFPLLAAMAATILLTKRRNKTIK